MSLIEVALSSISILHPVALARMLVGLTGKRINDSLREKRYLDQNWPVFDVGLVSGLFLTLGGSQGLEIWWEIAGLGVVAWVVGGLVLSNPASAAEATVSKSLLQTLFQHIDAGVLLSDAHGAILLANRRAEELLQLSVSDDTLCSETQLLGQIAFDETWEIITEEGLPVPFAATPIRQAIATQQPVRHAILGIRRKSVAGLESQSENNNNPDHPFHWLTVSATPHLDSTGNVVQVTCTLCDFLPHLDYQSRLQQAQANYHRLWENAQEGFFQVSLDGQYLNANPAFVTLFGYQSLDECLSELNQNSHHGYLEDQQHSQIWQQLQQDSTLTNVEAQIRCRDGTSRWITQTVYPVYDANAGLLYYEGTLQDITELKNAQALASRLLTSLHQSETRFQQLAANLPGIIFTGRQHSNGELSFQFVSGGCIDLCELHPQDILDDAHQLIDLLHPDDRPGWELALATANEHLQPWQWQGRLITLSGQIKWLKVMAQPEVQPNGDIIWDGLILDTTERQEAEAALTKSQQKLLLHFQQTPLAVIEWSLTFEVTEWNPAAEEIFGYPRREALGRHVVDFMVPGTATDKVLAGWRHLLTQKGGTRNTHENKTRDGRIIICEWYNTPLVDQSGMVIGVASLVQDITERKQSEAALKESEERFRATFEQAAVGMALVAPEGQFIRVNQRFCEILGYSPAEMLTLSFAGMTHPEDLDEYRHCIEAMLAGQIHADSRAMRYLCKNGQPVWVNLTISLVTEATDIPKYFVGVIEDITQRVGAEAALRESEERFRAIAEVTPTPLLICRVTDSTILYANPALIAIIGGANEDVIGRPTSEFLYHPEDQTRISELLEQQGSVRGVELCAKKIDGSPFWISLSVQPLTFNGEATLLGAFYDITERKRAESLLLERSRLSTLAAEIGVALVQSSTLPEILHRCTDVMELCLDISFAGIWTFNATTNMLELCSCVGEQPATTEFQDRIPLGFSMIGYIAQNHRPYLTPETAYGSGESSDFLAGYPLIIEERLVGVMAIMSRLPYTEASRSTLSWVANAIAVAIDRSWARQALISRREALLFQLASQIRTSLEINTILETTVREIRSLLHIDRCVFIWYSHHAKKPVLEVVTEAKEASLNSLLGHYPSRIIGSVTQKLLNLELIRVDDATEERDPALQRFAGLLSCHAILALPIQTRSGAIGVVGCGHYLESRPWNDSEVELLQAVTAQLAIAIDQAELYSQSVNAAAVAQAKAEQLEQTLQALRSTQAQLIQTEKMSSLGQLVAGVAHEINNPINFIYGNLSYTDNYTKDLLKLIQVYRQEIQNPNETILETIEEIDLDFLAEDLPKILTSMQVGTERIRQIVISLRNFSRLDEAEMKRVDLHEGIDSTLLILKNRLKPHAHLPGIEVIRHYGDLPKVECYAGQLNQVFMNILTNAIDAISSVSDTGQITIQTSVGQGEWEAGQAELTTTPYVQLQFIDNGPGMTPDILERIFDPFFTTKPVGQGIGLGLSVCYQIVVGKHKGVLQCFSQVGQGTELRLKIPIRQEGEG